MKPRLLIVELHHLGDAVMSLPFVRGAQDRYEVHVLCRPASRGIYELLSEPPKIHPWEPPWADDAPCSALASLGAARRQGRVLRAWEFNSAVCAWADTRAQLLMAETDAPDRIGFPMTHGNYYAPSAPWRRRRLRLGRLLELVWRLSHPARPLLTRPLHRESFSQPHGRCWEQIATALGTTCDHTVPWIKAPPAPTERQRPLLAIHAHARLPSKQWPLDRWREVLRHPDVRARFDLLEIVPPGSPRLALEACQQQETPDLAALVAALASSDAVLCHDSLPAHLAAALGKPVVTIFGSGEPDWFAPWHNRERVVQRRVCPLHPCIDRCGVDRFLCLDAVTVADVLGQLAQLPTKP